MSNLAQDEMYVLKLTLQGHLVGYLTGFHTGRNVLSFADEYRNSTVRPTFSLITHPQFPHSNKILLESWARHQRLHPILSNLLPEGALRTLMAQQLKVHIDNEFQLFSYLGQDLPGALVAESLAPEAVPNSVFALHHAAKAVKFEQPIHNHKFSLAGVQMKFSMKETQGRYLLSKENTLESSLENTLGDWIIKIPSIQHQQVPANEYTAMKLAELAGVVIPDIKLVELNRLDHLPQIALPNEKWAFAIKRFDRKDNQRIHMEDFAQVLVKYPHEKYNTASYEQMAKVLYQFSGDGLADAQQFARRLLVNILLANGDAHLKNWSLIYPDQITPRLSPAYDILTTQVYIENEHQFALNLGRIKAWYEVSYAHFEAWAKKADLPWRAIQRQLDDVMQAARTLWPEALKDLPMQVVHQKKLKTHWGKLHKDFKIE